MARDILVVLEAGARWPAWLDDEPGGLISFVQGSREPTPDFHARAEEGIRALSMPSGVAVLVAGDDAGDSSMVSRRALLVGLVTHLELGDGGKLVLIADGAYGARQSLASLALELSSFLEDIDSPVTCRLRAQPRAGVAA